MSTENLSISGGALVLIFLTVFAAGASPTLAAAGGVLACGGTNLRVAGGGPEGDQTYTVYRLENFDDAATILIDRVLVYSGEGDLICELPDSQPFPPRFNDLLGPHQSTRLTTYDLHATGCLPTQTFPADPTGVPRLSTFFYWSFVDKGLGNPLHASHGDIYQDRVTHTHTGRSSTVCREVVVK